MSFLALRWCNNIEQIKYFTNISSTQTHNGELFLLLDNVLTKVPEGDYIIKVRSNIFICPKKIFEAGYIQIGNILKQVK